MMEEDKVDEEEVFGVPRAMAEEQHDVLGMLTQMQAQLAEWMGASEAWEREWVEIEREWLELKRKRLELEQRCTMMEERQTVLVLVISTSSYESITYYDGLPYLLPTVLVISTSSYESITYYDGLPYLLPTCFSFIAAL